MSLACCSFITGLESTHASTVEVGTYFRGSTARYAIGTHGSIQESAEFAHISRQRHGMLPLKCPADIADVCVATLAEAVHLGRPQEKAVVPDPTPQPEGKSFFNAQANCECGLLSRHCNVLIELSSFFTEAVMSDLSCTRILVILGWLHIWGIPNGARRARSRD